MNTSSPFADSPLRSCQSCSRRWPRERIQVSSVVDGTSWTPLVPDHNTANYVAIHTGQQQQQWSKPQQFVSEYCTPVTVMMIDGLGVDRAGQWAPRVWPRLSSGLQDRVNTTTADTTRAIHHPHPLSSRRWSVLLLLLCLLTHPLCPCATHHDHLHHRSTRNSSRPWPPRLPPTHPPTPSTHRDSIDTYFSHHSSQSLYDFPPTDSREGVSSSGHYRLVVQYPRTPTELAQTKCVERCSCKWRSGKIWVECLHTALVHIPRGLDTGTQVLYLSGNPLRELEARVFERANLKNLQRLHLMSCSLSDIHGDAFSQLSNLIELDLSHNELSVLPAAPLVHCPILRKLNLAHNRLRAVRNASMNKLSQLQSIDMSNNQIELIETNAFYGLKNLKQLYLHENQLK